MEGKPRDDSTDPDFADAAVFHQSDEESDQQGAELHILGVPGRRKRLRGHWAPKAWKEGIYRFRFLGKGTVGANGLANLVRPAEHPESIN